jgi:hypothetical protein
MAWSLGTKNGTSLSPLIARWGFLLHVRDYVPPGRVCFFEEGQNTDGGPDAHNSRLARGVPLVGEVVAAGVAQHVRVGLELQAGADGDALDHTSDAVRADAKRCGCSPGAVMIGVAAIRR